MPEWRRDNLYLRYAVGIPLQEIRDAHAASKKALFAEIARRTGQTLDPSVMTIGFARRATPYKRADLIFSDLDRLTQIARTVGKLQIVYGGKAHPHDGGGKDLIRRIYSARERLGDLVKVVYIENYEMAVAGLMVAGVDLWLNNPMKPLEASGTSGMKAAINGVLNLSVLDGWWAEGYSADVGWAIEGSSDEADREQLYRLLEEEVVPTFTDNRARWVEMMQESIAQLAPRFSMHRAVIEYVERYYLPAHSSALR
jgi:glycogen phosphorylase